MSVGQVEVMKMVKRERKSKSHYEEGPFSSIFNGSMGRILDQTLLLGNMEFTISILAEATGLTYKTAASCLGRLQKMDWIMPTRQLGNAQAYRFNTNHMSKLIKWGTEFQATRRACDPI